MMMTNTVATAVSLIPVLNDNYVIALKRPGNKATTGYDGRVCDLSCDQWAGIPKVQ
jgi:hypothetical protein